jgi:hypothetical protein
MASIKPGARHSDTFARRAASSTVLSPARIEGTIRTFSSAGNTCGLAMTIGLLDGQTRKKRELPGNMTRDTATHDCTPVPNNLVLRSALLTYERRRRDFDVPELQARPTLVGVGRIVLSDVGIQALLQVIASPVVGRDKPGRSDPADFLRSG